MNILTEGMLLRFHEGGIASVQYIDSSRGEEDLRQTALVTYADGVRLAVKAASNSFTMPERVQAWADLTRAYRAVGVYCPLYVPALSGELCFYEDTEAGRVLVYAEEYRLYRSADEFDPPVPEERYVPDSLASIGKIAARPAAPVPWLSAYCLYDKFCEEDEMEETYENAVASFSLLESALPQRKSEILDFREEYLTHRSAFEAEYRALPMAVFQADLNDSNVLLADDGSFAGLIDFNLSGSECILNYALCESLCLPTEEEDLPRLMQPDALAEADRRLKENLAVIGRHYAFTPEERRAFPKLYRLIVPFRWPAFCLFRWAFQNGKAEYYNSILDWMLYQFRRTDLSI